ncbi:MAG: flotillin family protein [Fimbriimonadaceae bacterium]
MPDNLLQQLGGMGSLVLGALFAPVLLIVLAIIVKMFLKICGPNEVLIVSGLGRRRQVGGKAQGFFPVIGGRAFAIPGINRVDRMSLSLMEVPIGVHNAYSSGGIAMNVEAIANVKISSNDSTIGNAVERFLNRDVEEIRRVAKETLEGHLRGVVATLTPEQVNEDRLTFAEELGAESEADLAKLGLHLDTLKILHVSDEIGYLDATGRKAISLVVREAEIAESDAKRDAEQSESKALGSAQVKLAETERQIAQLRNELRRLKADLEAQVRSEEERTTAAAREARATAEQELQALRAQLETIRLQADTVLPAEAARKGAEFTARGQAASVRERGRALSESLDAVQAAWAKAGPGARQIALIEDLENLIARAAEGITKVKVESIHVLDSGDGKALPNYLTAYPEMLTSVFKALEAATGVDVPGTVSGRTKEVTK